MRITNTGLAAAVFLCLVADVACAKKQSKQASKKPEVVFQTSLGTIVVRLDQAKAPVSTENMLSYLKDKFYDGTVFHRVIPGFMVQGGGMTAELQKKATKPPIKNEAANGLLNKRGTVAMARTNVVDSATAQFFINLIDNAFLDHRSTDARGYGYAVIGEVIEGMDVVDKIAAVKTLCPSRGAPGPCDAKLPPGMRDVPADAVVIQKAYRR